MDLGQIATRQDLESLKSEILAAIRESAAPAPTPDPVNETWLGVYKVSEITGLAPATVKKYTRWECKQSGLSNYPAAPLFEGRRKDTPRKLLIEISQSSVDAYMRSKNSTSPAVQ